MRERGTGRESASILVVDDVPENIDVLRGVLRARYQIRIAINGLQALEIASSATPPDLILLDVMMPGMDGFEVCQKLKENPRTEGIPVIFVTAMTDACDEVRGFKVGGVDFINKPITPAIVLSRVKTHLKLRSAYKFMRETFGRYLSEEIVDSLFDSPQGLKLGGEKKEITIMMADLRGFTSISETLEAEAVVEMINVFLGSMTDVILKHQGTIDEFIGDAILTIFGAPIYREDNALRAVRCAVEMQLAMDDVNKYFEEQGYPKVGMGIGINTGQVIVGNVGSHKRSKYGVVGRNVNTTSRIESYTTGGQIFISEKTRDACNGLLRIDGEMKVFPKGLKEEITIYDVGGVFGETPVQLPIRKPVELIRLIQPAHLKITLMEEKHCKDSFHGKILQMNKGDMEVEAEVDCQNFSNLKISVMDSDQQIILSNLFVKVVKQISSSPAVFRVITTSAPPEAEVIFEQLLAFQH